MPLIPAVAMGIGAMSVSMLNLPLTSVLLATLLLGSDGVTDMPLAIIAVAVSFVVSARIAVPAQSPASPTGGGTQPSVSPPAGRGSGP